MFMKDSNVSLKEFHIVFITASVLLSLGVATWGLVQYNQLHGRFYVETFILSSIAAVGLTIYEVYFVKKMKASDDR